MFKAAVKSMFYSHRALCIVVYRVRIN